MRIHPMKNFCMTALGLLTLATLASAADDPAPVVTELDRITVLVPAGTTGKLPVVFLAHNGNEPRKDWGDYPAELARKGFKLSDGPTKTGTGAMIAFIDAPEGYEVELVQAARA